MIRSKPSRPYGDEAHKRRRRSHDVVIDGGKVRKAELRDARRVKLVLVAEGHRFAIASARAPQGREKFCHLREGFASKTFEPQRCGLISIVVIAAARRLAAVFG